MRARPVLLRALAAMLYAHWEGYVKFCAEKYFDYVTVRRLRERCELITEIITSKENRFSRVNSRLIDTGSNLSSKILRDICLVCAIDSRTFDASSDFIDRILLKRRNE